MKTISSHWNIAASVQDVDRAQFWFRRHGAAAVFFARLMPGGADIRLAAGRFSPMPLAQFLLHSAPGTVIWTAALADAGVVLHANFTVIGDDVDVATNVLLGAIAIMFVSPTSCGPSEMLDVP